MTKVWHLDLQQWIDCKPWMRWCDVINTRNVQWTQCYNILYAIAQLTSQALLPLCCLFIQKGNVNMNDALEILTEIENIIGDLVLDDSQVILKITQYIIQKRTEFEPAKGDCVG